MSRSVFLPLHRFRHGRFDVLVGETAASEIAEGSLEDLRIAEILRSVLLLKQSGNDGAFINFRFLKDLIRQIFPDAPLPKFHPQLKQTLLVLPGTDKSFRVTAVVDVMKGTDILHRVIYGFGRESSLPKLLAELKLGPVGNRQKAERLLSGFPDDFSLDLRMITQ